MEVHADRSLVVSRRPSFQRAFEPTYQQAQVFISVGSLTKASIVFSPRNYLRRA